jgi:uncharacterized protein (TIGR00730 family)
MEDQKKLPNESGDFRNTWKIFRIMSEFVEGYQFLSGLEKEVSILGSARTKDGEKYFELAEEVGALLGKGGYTVLTGGGPGIMQAANKGSFEAGGESVGINIELPFEQSINPYVKKSTNMYYFFTRKVMLTSPAHAFVFFPGGFGTMDEFFEVVDHMELGKMCQLPVVLVGKEYWEPLLAFLRDKMCGVCNAHSAQIDSWHVVDTAQEAYDIIASSEDTGGRKECELSALSFHGPAQKMDWKIFRIMAELVEGFEFLTGLVEDVTVLGTKSVKHDSPHYENAYKLGHALAENGFSVVTGGASGIAEAVNKGAIETGGESLGIGMEMYGRDKMNKYLSKRILFKFPFTRKLIITAPSKAFVFFPGGFGTMHQMFEVLTLIQTNKMPKIPVILFGKDHWGPLVDYINDILATKFQTISSNDPDLFTVVDTVEEATKIINKFREK